MSGVVFGLIGYVWMKGRTQPQLGLGLLPDQVVWAILWMLLCIGGAFGPIANAAHVSGLIVGMLIGARQAIWKRLKNSVQSQSGGKT
jgi:GlpG protein